MFKQSLIHIPDKIYVQVFHTVFCRGFCEDLMGLAKTPKGEKTQYLSKTANFLSIKLCFLIRDSEVVSKEGINRARKVWKKSLKECNSSSWHFWMQKTWHSLKPESLDGWSYGDQSSGFKTVFWCLNLFSLSLYLSKTTKWPFIPSKKQGRDVKLSN